MMPNQLPGAIPRVQAPPAQAQWQAPPQPRMPSPAHLASGAYDRPPITARGVSATAQPPAAPRYTLPSPQTLGVSSNLSLSAPTTAAAAAPVDWHALQMRMQRLGVLRYQKSPAENGAVQVTLLLPTSDPTQGQPISAQAAGEAEAVVLILNYAEDLARKR